MQDNCNDNGGNDEDEEDASVTMTKATNDDYSDGTMK